jgi:hypothetical protein
MSRYERTFDTDCEQLDADQAADRAYAIGVAERLGEYNREALERIYEETDTAYGRSMVELAYEEGRREAKAVAGEDGTDSFEDVWTELVEGGPDVDDEDPPTGGRDGLPEALDSTELLDRPTADSTDSLDRPGFLDR